MVVARCVVGSLIHGLVRALCYSFFLFDAPLTWWWCWRRRAKDRGGKPQIYVAELREIDGCCGQGSCRAESTRKSNQLRAKSPLSRGIENETERKTQLLDTSRGILSLYYISIHVDSLFSRCAQDPRNPSPDGAFACTCRGNRRRCCQRGQLQAVRAAAEASWA